MILCALSLFSGSYAARATEPLLLRAGRYGFPASDFEYVYRKNNLYGKQTPGECLEEYIPYKLKLIAAKEAGLDTLRTLVDKWTDCCLRFVRKCLTDSILRCETFEDPFRESLYEIKTAHLLMKIDDADTLTAYPYISGLKKRYAFAENTALPAGRRNPADTLFSFAGVHVRMSDFEAYKRADAPHDAEKNSRQSYCRFVRQTLLEYETRRMLESERFRGLFGEYLDGCLLFEITEREVFRKAVADTAGVRAFYRKHARRYRRKRQMEVTLYTCGSRETAVRVAKAAGDRNAGNGRKTPDDLYSFSCNSGDDCPCVDTARFILPKGANIAAGRIKRKKGVSKIWEWNGKFVFLDVHAALPPARKTFEEARAEAIAGYEKEIERRWTDALKAKYPVEVDKMVWKELKNKYVE
jgi:hypothetical protein